MNDTSEVSRWPHGKVGIKNAPPDEPICGFDGKKCPELDEQPGRLIISSQKINLRWSVKLICSIEYLSRGQIKPLCRNFDRTDEY